MKKKGWKNAVFNKGEWHKVNTLFMDSICQCPVCSSLFIIPQISTWLHIFSHSWMCVWQWEFWSVICAHSQMKSNKVFVVLFGVSVTDTVFIFCLVTHVLHSYSFSGYTNKFPNSVLKYSIVVPSMKRLVCFTEKTGM